ncbi:MAG: hypothetical protein OXO54_13725 [Chloroflexota bacterium]|nr:hypothetical protein [Chloroflexota bacterium]MDE2899370.1 hypothetical protein [Chloroflexota bacterium]
MLKIERLDGRLTLQARTPGHDDAAEYAFAPADYEALHRTVEQTLAEAEPARFERACLAALAGLSDEDEASPAQRRYVSQSLDEEAVRRGLLLRAHWHCPRCGAPGSQWTPGCLRIVCDEPAPTSLAHWDLCRVASADELLTLMVSEGYERIGASAHSARLRRLRFDLTALLRSCRPGLARRLTRWAEEADEVHAVRATDMLDLAARLGTRLQAGPDSTPEADLTAALTSAQAEPTGAPAKEYA